MKLNQLALLQCMMAHTWQLQSLQAMLLGRFGVLWMTWCSRLTATVVDLTAFSVAIVTAATPLPGSLSDCDTAHFSKCMACRRCVAAATAQAMERKADLCSCCTINDLRVAQVASVGGLIQGRDMLQQCGAHAVQLEHVAVLAGACLYLQDGAASILLHNALQTTCDQVVCFAC